MRRPVQTFAWVACVAIGIVVLSLLSTGIARETRWTQRGPLKVTSSLQADAQSSRFVVLCLQVAPIDDLDNDTIYNLRLRVDNKDAKNLKMEVLSPMPSQVQRSGTGLYFVWNQIAPRQVIRVRLQPQGPNSIQLIGDSFDDKVIVPLPVAQEIAPVSPARPLDLLPYRSN